MQELRPAAIEDRLDPVRGLTSAAAAVHGPFDVGDKLRWVAEMAQSVTGASVCAVIGLGTPNQSSVVVGVEALDLERIARPVLATLLSAGHDSPQIIRAQDLAGDPRYRALARRAGLGSDASCVAVPVNSAAGAVLAAILVCHPSPARFGPAEENAVMALAAHLGVALDNLETMNRLAELQAVQREVVHQLQEAVRPPMPAVEAAELGVHYLPADPSAPTGGDLYDWLVLPDGSLHLAVVDVMGKGVSATKDALAVTHALRLLVLDGCPMEDLVARADQLTTAQNPGLVATVVVARYSPSDGKVRLAGGGHPPPIVIAGEEGDAKADLVPASGIPIGFPGAGSSEVVMVTLGRHDTLVLYTDGLVEATKDIVAGLENITCAAAEIGRYPAPHMARALVERSLAGAKRRDDSVALVLRRRVPPGSEGAPPLGAFEYRFSPHPATVPLGRHLLGDWLDNLSVEEAERSDLLLVASELCSNAIRHSSGAPSSLVMRAWADSDAVIIEVEDDGSGFELDARYDDDMPDPDAERGRGLFVVEALTDHLTVLRRDDRTVVRAVRRAVLPGA